jgi:hypothetical protein
MRTLAAVALAAAGAILMGAAAGRAQQAQTVLPDVAVTAPVAPPPRFSPNSGKVRVEEDKWPQIPCDRSRIASGAAGKCQTSPPVESFMSGTPTGGDPGAGGSDCTIAHHLLSLDIGPLAVEADALIFDPYKLTASMNFNKHCKVWSGFRDMPEDFKDLNQVTRRGVGWRNFVPGGTQSGAQSTIEFSDGRRGCVALERLGPPWRGGYVWVVHATICQPGTLPVEKADIDTVFNALQLRVYDPTGNLRPPG